MNPMDRVNQIKLSSPLLMGMMYAFLYMFIGAIFTSILFITTNMKEESLTTYVYIIHCIAVILGAFVVGRRAGNKGWYHGGVLGIIYSIITLMIGYLGLDTQLTMNTIWIMLVALVIGAIGGIVGVNARK